MTNYRSDIEKYIKGELSPAERHALEKKALSDPFLAEALEGAEQLASDEFLQDVASLNRNLVSRKEISIWRWPARIAAGLAIIAVSTYIVWSVAKQEPRQDLAMEKKELPISAPVTTDSMLTTTETHSTSSSKLSEKGPSKREKVAASRSENAQIAEAKPKTENELDKKTESVEDKKMIIAEMQGEETKITEPTAQVKQMERVLNENNKADDEEVRKLAGSGAKKKIIPSSKDLAQPSQESRVAGAAVASIIISGHVTSADDDSALPGINVVIKGTTMGTITNEHGNYQIKVPSDNPELTFSFIGLQGIEIKVGERNQVNVQMKQDETQRSEVVVRGSRSQSAASLPPTVDLAHPEIGNRAFKQYLEKNIRYPEVARTSKTEGYVTVEFTIEQNGTLTTFIVLNGIGNGCDEELIRLINEGPKWVPTQHDGIPIQDKARVRLKFVPK